MISSKKIIALLLFIVLVSATACEKSKIEEEDKVPVSEDPTNESEASNNLSVSKVDYFENIEISDWLDDSTVIVSKENIMLEKISLSELSDSFPRSLYLFKFYDDQYELLKAKDDINLGGATLSNDKKSLLYYEFTLGDPSFTILNMDTLLDYNIIGAMSGKWVDNETVIGSSYSGGAYTSTLIGEISQIKGLDVESLVIVDKINDSIYYNTSYDESLWRLDISTSQKFDLNMRNIYSMVPSPKMDQMIVVQSDGSSQTIAIYDTLGLNRIQVAEGIEVNGIGWSPNQEFISYSIKTDANSKDKSGLYIYEIKSNKSILAVSDLQIMNTSWSPSGDKLSFVEWNGSDYNSGIVFLKKSK